MGVFRVFSLATLLLAVSLVSAQSQDVTLQSRDGSVEISGTILSFDGEYYRIETQYGKLAVDASGVTCTGPGCPNMESYVARVSFSGSTEIVESLLPRLIQTFSRLQGYEEELSVADPVTSVFTLADKGARGVAAVITVHAISSDEAFADLISGEADIAISSRPIAAQESGMALEAGLAISGRAIALDAIVPVVAPTNSVSTISVEKLAKVYSGEIDNWRDLGGVDAPISLHIPRYSSGISAEFLRRVMVESGKTLSEKAVQHDTLAGLSQAVSNDPFAIGISALSAVGPARVLRLSDNCGYVHRVTFRSLASEDYPLVAPIFMYAPASHLPRVMREFLRFLRSPAAQIAVRRASYGDLSLSETPIERQGGRLANAIMSAGKDVGLKDLQDMVSVLRTRQRLNLTFRFKEKTGELDAFSRSRVEDLARALESGTLDAREILFAGFSDGTGSADKNRRLARERAKLVRSAVITSAATADLSQFRLKAKGFGELMPMACDDTPWGRKTNRRVEVWIRK